MVHADLDVGLCREELNSVLASRSFRNAPALSKILSYICHKHLDGADDSSINEWNIALDALGRSAEFDPEKDSIVRVDFHLLRKRLADFYANEGAGHAIRITLPKSGYAPRFKMADRGSKAEAPEIKQPEAPAASKRSWPARLFLKVGLAIVVLCAATYLISSTTRKASARTQSRPSPAAPMAEVKSQVRILAGFSSPEYIDSSGQVWSGDAYASGGSVFYRPDRQIAGTLDQQIYRRGREGNFRYDIPLEPGLYELHLHFAETLFGQTPLDGAEARRFFDVTLNGRTLLQHFDLSDDAGGPNIADMKVFENARPAADGYLHLAFSGFTPLLNAIEILPDVSGRPLPVRIVCSMHAVFDRKGEIWQSDRYFMGGRESDHGTDFTGPDDASLYTSARFGNFSYAIPVAAGHDYKATVKFVDTSYDAPGKRLFDLFCNERTLLRSFDVVKASGGEDRMMQMSFDDLHPNAQGKLIFRFVPVRDYAVVRAIEVDPG